MGDQAYRLLIRVAVVLTIAWVGWSVYEGFFSNTGPHYRKLTAADRYFEDARYAEALNEYQEILDQDPENDHALGGKAQALMQLGRNAEALGLLDRLIDRKPESGVAFANRGILKDRMGDYAGALADYERSLSLTPEVADGPGLLTRFLRNQPRKPPTVAQRADYIRRQLARPEAERLLRVPAEDARQRPYRM